MLIKRYWLQTLLGSFGSPSLLRRKLLSLHPSACTNPTKQTLSICEVPEPLATDSGMHKKLMSVWLPGSVRIRRANECGRNCAIAVRTNIQLKTIEKLCWQAEKRYYYPVNLQILLSHLPLSNATKEIRTVVDYQFLGESLT